MRAKWKLHLIAHNDLSPTEIKTLSNATGPLVKMNREILLKVSKPSPEDECCIFKQFISIEGCIRKDYGIP